MAKRIPAAALALAAAGLIAIAIGAGARAAAPHAEAAARVRVAEANLIKALNDRNLEAIMACYSAKPDLVVFDLIPPLQYAGPVAWRKNWKGFLGSITGTMKVVQTNLVIEASRRIAFAHGFWHMTISDAKGHSAEMTLRVTDCFENQGGKWLIVHEHISLPTDLATGRAVIHAKL